jgi:hypothetical protein
MTDTRRQGVELVAARRASATALQAWYVLEESCAEQGIPINVVRPDRPLNRAQQALVGERNAAWSAFVAARNEYARISASHRRRRPRR